MTRLPLDAGAHRRSAGSHSGACCKQQALLLSSDSQPSCARAGDHHRVQAVRLTTNIRPVSPQCQWVKNAEKLPTVLMSMGGPGRYQGKNKVETPGRAGRPGLFNSGTNIRPVSPESKIIISAKPSGQKLCGNAGFRSRCLAHAKRALCQLSYAPVVKTLKATIYILCHPPIKNCFPSHDW